MIVANLPSASLDQGNISEPRAPVEAYMFAKLEKLDDKIPALYTARFILNLESYTNRTFRGVVLFAHPLNRSETLDLPIFSTYDPAARAQYWSNNGTAFFKDSWFWYLFSEGVFPWDSYNWPILLGCNESIALMQGQFESTTPEVTSQWNVTPPRFSSFSTNPSDEELHRIGVQPSMYHMVSVGGNHEMVSYPNELRVDKTPIFSGSRSSTGFHAFLF